MGMAPPRREERPGTGVRPYAITETPLEEDAWKASGTKTNTELKKGVDLKVTFARVLPAR